MPVTPFTEVFCTGSNRLALKFAKTKPELDWGSIFDFQILIDGVDAMTGQRMN